MSEPLAYLLTWTCYGTWLHGDDRGSVDWEHNAPREEFAPPDPVRESVAREVMRGEVVRLSAAARRVVHEVVKKHCDVRDWSLHALNVRSNHVHAVVSCDLLPKEAMRQFKEWATRALRRGGHVGTEAKVWTEGGSARWLWKDESVRRAVRYVIEYQGEGKRG